MFIIWSINFHHSGRDLQGFTIGLAYIGTMCFRNVAIGLTQDGGSGTVEAIASTAAHEVGHIFNMLHDSGR